jgi:hypothetical protein
MWQPPVFYSCNLDHRQSNGNFSSFLTPCSTNLVLLQVRGVSVIFKPTMYTPTILAFLRILLLFLYNVTPIVHYWCHRGIQVTKISWYQCFAGLTIYRRPLYHSGMHKVWHQSNPNPYSRGGEVVRTKFDVLLCKTNQMNHMLYSNVTWEFSRVFCCRILVAYFYVCPAQISSALQTILGHNFIKGQLFLYVLRSCIGFTTHFIHQLLGILWIWELEELTSSCIMLVNGWKQCVNRVEKNAIVLQAKATKVTL